MDHHMVSPDRVCYVHCNFCNTILAVSVPCSSLQLGMVTVRCGHCANLLSVNMAAEPELESAPPSSEQIQNHNMMISSFSLPPPPLNQSGIYQQRQQVDQREESNKNKSNMSAGPCSLSSSSSSSSPPISNFKRSAAGYSEQAEPAPRTPPIRPPERRQRVPSAYNKFIKEEIQRIKVSNPEISHREAFSLAAKNWAHFPKIHFGLNLGASQTIHAEGTQLKTPGSY